MDIDPPAPTGVNKARKVALIAELQARNRLSHSPVCGAAPIALSLTSYGARLAIVAYAIESIARGTVRPRRMILWVSDADFHSADYPMLARLERRGLEILRCSDLGPHKKSHPYVTRFADDPLVLVTADDDIMYPRTWMAGLLAGYRRFPADFVGYRAKEVVVTSSGELAAYPSWPSAAVGASGPRVFVTGGAGVVFPHPLMRAMRSAGDSFIDTCPRADDIWINVQAMRAGLRARRLGCDGFALGFPRSQGEVALHTDNVGRGGNDRQLAATLTEADLAVLRAG